MATNEVIIDLSVDPPIAKEIQGGKCWRETPLTRTLAKYLTCRVCGGPCSEEWVARALRMHEQQTCCSLCLNLELVREREEYRDKWGRYPSLSK
jgi:hypothetical protein